MWMLPRWAAQVISLRCLTLALTAIGLDLRADTNKRRVTEVVVFRIGCALGKYNDDNGTYPTTLEGLNALAEAPSEAIGWNGTYMRKMKIIRDSWDNKFVYRSTSIESSRAFYFYLTAEDGLDDSGNHDDFAHWKLSEPYFRCD